MKSKQLSSFISWQQMLPPSPPWCLAVRAGQIIVERHAVNLEQFVETADKADAADKAEKAEKARTSGEVKISHSWDCARQHPAKRLKRKQLDPWKWCSIRDCSQYPIYIQYGSMVW